MRFSFLKNTLRKKTLFNRKREIIPSDLGGAFHVFTENQHPCSPFQSLSSEGSQRTQCLQTDCWGVWWQVTDEGKKVMALLVRQKISSKGPSAFVKPEWYPYRLLKKRFKSTFVFGWFCFPRSALGVRRRWQEQMGEGAELLSQA